jgi:hypothetical protein
VIKLRISDEELVNAACTSAQSFVDIDVAALRRAIEAVGIEAPELEQLRIENARLRSLLSSGRCVDLAKVTDAEIGSAVSAHPVTNAEEGASVRAALLELAEVKL